MAKKYQVNARVKMINRMMVQMLRWNIAPKQIYLLSVRGRKTGKLYSLPVSLVEKEGKRYLVSPYGESNWVKNARAAGEVSLQRNGNKEKLKLIEIGPKESAAVLKEYIKMERIVRPYFDVKPDDSLKAFEAETHLHPVFLLERP